MEDPIQNGGPLLNISNLINALHEMRDELVKTSLMLKDYQSYWDPEGHSEATADSNELLNKFKSS